MKLNEEPSAEPTRPTRVADGLVRIPLVTPTLPPATRTNSYLVEGETGWTLVDLGPDDPVAIEIVLSAADTFADGRDRIIALLLTHHHRDHVGGLTAWRTEVGLPVIAHRASWDRLPGEPGAMDVVVDGDGRWDGRRVWHTPGHAPGHLAMESSGGWLVGDLMAGTGTILVDPADGSMQDYLNSLARLTSCEGRGWPAHGPALNDVASRARDYQSHRLRREARVLGALTKTPADLMDLTRLAWADVSPALHGFASRSALAHLQKLETEGLAARDEAEKWRLVSG